MNRFVWGHRHRIGTNGFYDPFKDVHPDARIDDSVIVFGDPANLHVGAGSRIDAFCVLSVGTDPAHGVRIGRRTHVGCGCYLFGSSGRIAVGDCCSLSPRVTVYTATDVIGDANVIGATAQAEYRQVRQGNVTLKDGAALFTGVIVLPDVMVGTGEYVSTGKVLLNGEYLRGRNAVQIRDRIRRTFGESG